MLKFERFHGMIAAVFTPMDKHGEVNLDVINEYAEWIASTPIKGVFVCGTTGEFSSLTIEERKAILERWVGSADKKFKVIAHVGANCQKSSIELTRHAASIGVDAVASIAPSFFKPKTVTDLIDFFVPISAAAKYLPFYYYNMPSITGVDLPVDKFLIEGKKVMPNLCGTKFTHNNLMEMAACIDLNNHEFEVLHGFDEILISGLAMGAIAGVGSTYNYIPKIYSGIFDAMEKGDLETARKLQLKSIKMVEIIIRYGGGVRGGKAVMNVAGIECGDCRLPIAAFKEEEFNRLKEDLLEVGFPEF